MIIQIIGVLKEAWNLLNEMASYLLFNGLKCYHRFYYNYFNFESNVSKEKITRKRKWTTSQEL